MAKELRIVRKKLVDNDAKPTLRMTSAQLSIAAEKMSREIEARAALRERGKLPPEDDILEITEWI